MVLDRKPERSGQVTFNPRDVMADAKAIVVAVYPYTPYSDDFPGTGIYSAYYEYPVVGKLPVN